MRQAVTTADPATFEIEELESETPGRGEVVLRIRGCGICGSDLHAYRDRSRWTAGRVLGHEIAGEVATLGAGVTGLRVGQRVALQPRLFCGECAECRGGRTELCVSAGGLHGLQLPGGFRETLTVPQENLFPVADDLDFAVAALTEPLAVAVHGHRVAAQLDAARPTRGERVVVLGAGPIGLMSVFYARQAGATEVAVTALGGRGRAPRTRRWVEKDIVGLRSYDYASGANQPRHGRPQTRSDICVTRSLEWSGSVWSVRCSPRGPSPRARPSHGFTFG